MDELINLKQHVLIVKRYRNSEQLRQTLDIYPALSFSIDLTFSNSYLHTGEPACPQNHFHLPAEAPRSQSGKMEVQHWQSRQTVHSEGWLRKRLFISVALSLSDDGWCTVATEEERRRHRTPYFFHFSFLLVVQKHICLPNQCSGKRLLQLIPFCLHSPFLLLLIMSPYSASHKEDKHYKMKSLSR